MVIILQYLKIDRDTKLQTLANRIGDRNLERLLSVNDLVRSPNIGNQFFEKCKDVYNDPGISDVTWQRKQVILNTMTQDSDVFEEASLLDSDGWKVLSTLGTFPNMLKIPETSPLPSATDILGDSKIVSQTIYLKAMNQLKANPHIIDPGIFNEYSTIKGSSILDYSNNAYTSYWSETTSNSSSSNINLTQWFKLPTGEVTLYSYLADNFIDFPVYPEEIEDHRNANYTQMPDMLYQYEPWMLYESSGPRSNTYSFTFHRDMFTGNHNDGKANELIRFCQANCYPKYNGSAVHTSTVTLYVSGSPLITGVLTSVDVNWSGPLLSDGWYAVADLKLAITEISKEALNFNSVLNKPLIG